MFAKLNGAGARLTATAVMLVCALNAGADSKAPTPAADKADTVTVLLRGRKVAAVAFPQNTSAELVRKNTQSRFESILVENEVTVLDEKKAGDLKDVCKGMDDPPSPMTMTQRSRGRQGLRSSGIDRGEARG